MDLGDKYNSIINSYELFLFLFINFVIFYFGLYYYDDLFLMEGWNNGRLIVRV